MPALGLRAALLRRTRIDSDGFDSFFELHGGHYAPGYIVAVTALARRSGVRFADIRCAADLRSYAQALGVESALDGMDNYQHPRLRKGINYSPLVLLENEVSTDSANSTICDCIRNLFRAGGHASFVKSACSVVGDLHDNVWSHGMSTGFSIAQKWKKPNVDNAYLFEFALADCGIGFLRELQRVGLPIADDRSAIDWCMVRGNSSKKVREIDQWQQRLPADMIGNPMPGIGRPVASENHHMGIGLAKLGDFVTEFSGELCIASGAQIMSIDGAGQTHYIDARREWPGVAIACRFDSERLARGRSTEPDELTRLIAEAFGDDHDDFSN